MSAAHEVLRHLNAIGATIEPTGDRLLLRAGLRPVPADVIRRVKEAKAELLALLHHNDPALTATCGFARAVEFAVSEPPLEQPCAARRGRVQELDGAFLLFGVQF